MAFFDRLRQSYRIRHFLWTLLRLSFPTESVLQSIFLYNWSYLCRKSMKKRGKPAPHRFSTEGDFVARLEGPERRALIPRDDIIPRMGLKKSDIVVDLGAGIGYFSIPISSLAGQVVSIDIEPRMHEMIASRMREGNIGNIDLVRAEITRIPISDFAVDHVLAAFVYHEVDDRRMLMAEASRILRAGGRLTVVDFQKRETSIGPPVSERRTPKEVVQSAPKNLSLFSRSESETYYQLEFLKG